MSTSRKLLLVGAAIIGAIAIIVLCYGVVAASQSGVFARGLALFAIACVMFLISRLV